MSHKLQPINREPTNGALNWSPTLGDSFYLENVFVNIDASPTTPEMMKLTYTPPDDANGNSGTSTVWDSVVPSTGSNDTQKQNIVFRVNSRFSRGGTMTLSYANTDDNDIGATFEFDTNPNL